jgi:hypothetical protein
VRIGELEGERLELDGNLGFERRWERMIVRVGELIGMCVVYGGEL